MAQFPYRRRFNVAGFAGAPKPFASILPDIARNAINDAAIRRVTTNIANSAREQFDKYKGAFDILSNLNNVLESGGNFDAQLAAAYTLMRSVATEFGGAYGAAIGTVLDVMQKLTKWLAEAMPRLPDTCNTMPIQASQHYCVTHGLATTALLPDDAAYLVWTKARKFFIGNALYRLRARDAYKPAEGCFWSWHDYPMIAPADATLRDQVVSTEYTDSSYTGDSGIPTATIGTLRTVYWKDSYVSNPDFTYRPDVASADLKIKTLSVVCRPRRVFPGPCIFPSMLDWYDYLREYPDVDGANAAIAIGDRIANKLVADGAEYQGWGYDADGRGGYRSWLSGYWIGVEQLDDETIFGLLRWFTTLPTETVTAGNMLPSDIEPIPPGNPGAGEGWGWMPGLDLFLRDFIIRNGKYMRYHYGVLLDEYKRRRDAGTWTIKTAAAGGTPSKFALPGKTKTGQTVQPQAAGIPAAAVVGGVGVAGLLAWLLLK